MPNKSLTKILKGVQGHHNCHLLSPVGVCCILLCDGWYVLTSEPISTHKLRSERCWFTESRRQCENGVCVSVCLCFLCNAELIFLWQLAEGGRLHISCSAADSDRSIQCKQLPSNKLFPMRPTRQNNKTLFINPAGAFVSQTPCQTVRHCTPPS